MLLAKERETERRKKEEENYTENTDYVHSKDQEELNHFQSAPVNHQYIRDPKSKI